MKPWTLTVLRSSACTAAGKVGTIFFFSALAVTCDSSFQETMSARSSSGLKGLRGSW